MVPPSDVGRDALLLGHQLVEQQQDGGGGVDGHRRRHLVEGEAGEQQAHVGERVDGHPDLAHLALGARVVGVVPHLGGQVEGARQPGLAGRQQELEALVGGLGGPEPGVLAHRPQPAPVHVGSDAPRVGVRAGLAELRSGVPAVEVGGRVHGADLDAGVGPPHSPSSLRSQPAKRDAATPPSSGLSRRRTGPIRRLAVPECGMHRSSYSAITISPAFSPHAGHSGSRRTLKVRKDSSRAS